MRANREGYDKVYYESTHPTRSLWFGWLTFVIGLLIIRIQFFGGRADTLHNAIWLTASAVRMINSITVEDSRIGMEEVHLAGSLSRPVRPERWRDHPDKREGSHHGLQ